MTRRLRIESSGSTWPPGATRVYLDGLDITSDVSAVTWQIDTIAHTATATVTFVNADIDAEADLDLPDTDAPADSARHPAASSNRFIPEAWSRELARKAVARIVATDPEILSGQGESRRLPAF